jgi:hypothetical protein
MTTVRSLPKWVAYVWHELDKDRTLHPSSSLSWLNSGNDFLFLKFLWRMRNVLRIWKESAFLWITGTTISTKENPINPQLNTNDLWTTYIFVLHRICATPLPPCFTTAANAVLISCPASNAKRAIITALWQPSVKRGVSIFDSRPPFVEHGYWLLA